mmetsp:Transcript_43921/g.133785  ORF Transcript_43921/g.133785 Transcript_43921/m.133785 type:complete len:448 (-) Transcript_43921:487-1830(-)
MTMPVSPKRRCSGLIRVLAMAVATAAPLRPSPACDAAFVVPAKNDVVVPTFIERGAGGGARRAAADASSSSDATSTAAATSTSTAGPVLSPSEEGDDPNRFDSSCAANPVVLPPSATGLSRWRMYYYGNAGSWAGGRKNFLPTGWIGMAESDDGISWTKAVGAEEGGSILAPTGNPDDWDGIQIGLGDVVRANDEEMHMYYFGGSGEEVLPNMPGVAGFRMRIGRARSIDGGKTWERMGDGPVLDYDEEEGLFASWPRLMIPEEGEDDDDKPWRMTYHAFNGRRWAAFGATSRDGGETWTRDGMMLGPGPEGSWDESGVGTRAVLRRPGGGWDMVYEAVDKGGTGGGTHRLGVAHLVENDEDGTYSWVKAEGPEFEERGGPMLGPGEGPLGPWTSQVIGTPFLVGMEDGSVRLYYVTRSPETSHAIGLVVSDSGELKPSSWKEISPN